MRVPGSIFALGLLLTACAPDVPLAPPSAASGSQAIRLCSYADEVRELSGWIDARTGDTLVAGRPIGDAIPVNTYVSKSERLGNIHFQYHFSIYAQPRPLDARDLRRVGEFQGVSVYRAARDLERGEPLRNGVIYLPAGPGCLFQPYQDESVYGEVRG